MRHIIFLAFILSANQLFAQSAGYKTWVARADSLSYAGQAREAAEAYSTAFSYFGWKGFVEDRYKAARAWTLAGVPDSAFFQLNKLVDKLLLKDDAKLIAEPDFSMLHKDFRWTRMLTQIQIQRTREAAQSNDPLVIELEKIHYLDQWFRIKRDSVLSLYGSMETVGYKKFNKEWIIQDSLNTFRVSEILDQKGWLGPKEVGEYASGTFYIVIQHAPLTVQEKYLPLMQKAVKDGNASATNLAYLEDRILMRNNKPQRYGSQVTSDKVTNEWILHPVEDPANLDARRAAVGLGPISEYLEMMGAKWKQ